MAEELNKQSFETVETSMIERVLNDTDGLDIDEQRDYVETADFDFIIENLLLVNVIRSLRTIHNSVFIQLQNESGKTPEEMTPVLDDYTIISELDQQQILRSGAEYGSEFKSQLLKGLNSGQTTQQMLTETNIPNFKFNWNLTAYNTAIDQFQASATAAVFEDNPNQLFKLAGPLDDKTRCECRAVLTEQPKTGFTKRQVDQGFLTKIVKKNCPDVKPESQIYSWVGRGGFNCRHFYDPI